MNDSITFTAYGETYTVYPEFGTYENGRLAITFFDEDGVPFSKVTTNLPDQHLNEGEIFVKHWAENGPIVEALLKAGWLAYAGREVASGHVMPEVMRPIGRLAELIEEYNS
jgi:hypothetical protein